MMAVCFTAPRQVSLVAAVTRARIPRNKRRIRQLHNYTFVVEEDRGVGDLFIRFLWDLLPMRVQLDLKHAFCLKLYDRLPRLARFKIASASLY